MEQLSKQGPNDAWPGDPGGTANPWEKLDEVYPLVMTNIANWKITIDSGFSHEQTEIFHSYVELPEGNEDEATY